jgi:uncharacterized protein (TIGR03435 family)
MNGQVRIGLALTVGLALAGQERPAAGPAFEVASVKHVGDVQSTVTQEGNMSRTNLVPCRFLGGSVTCKTKLMAILTEAYGVKQFQVQGPGWMDNEVYEIAARMPAETSRETARQMMQAMLADRLALQLRREQKEFSVFALVVIPGTTKLAEITPAPTTFGYRVGINYLETNPGMRLSALADMLTRSAGRPVLDETGHTGVYKVSLHWNPSDPPRPEGGVVHIGTDSGMIAALAQVGLKLEPVKRTMHNLVIEKVEKEPTAN